MSFYFRYIFFMLRQHLFFNLLAKLGVRSRGSSRSFLLQCLDSLLFCLDPRLEGSIPKVELFLGLLPCNESGLGLATLLLQAPDDGLPLRDIKGSGSGSNPLFQPGNTDGLLYLRPQVCLLQILEKTSGA
ncbi:uncharacterized protein A4U43_C07F4460 [Asparagus officinalis]|uniref:Uncharacterized protein n=1 Tax=Asparagus officinalis TaxID=4686 RepID=A0A5P1ECH3_ASPOF|nr:uncharacterized protein A4U43_C07F4460 [Asparagus officinalis]